MPTFRKSAFAIGLSFFAAMSAANAEDFDVPAGDLELALSLYSAQSGVPLMVSTDAVKGAKTAGVRGDLASSAALSRILAGTGFMPKKDSSGAISIIRGNSQSSQAN